MARLGHASVFPAPVGLDSSDPVHRNDVCFGTYADHIQQVIAQLRAGTYAVPVDLILVSGLNSNIEVMWEEPGRAASPAWPPVVDIVDTVDAV